MILSGNHRLLNCVTIITSIHNWILWSYICEILFMWNWCFWLNHLNSEQLFFSADKSTCSWYHEAQQEVNRRNPPNIKVKCLLHLFNTTYTCSNCHKNTEKNAVLLCLSFCFCMLTRSFISLKSLGGLWRIAVGSC